MEKLRTIRLYGKLGTKYGRIHKLYISSTNEAIRALSMLKPGFYEALRDSDQHGIAYAVFHGRRNIDVDDLENPLGDDDIRIAPILQGHKKAGLFQTIIGAVLIAAAFVYTGGAAAGLAAGTIGGTALTAGVGMMLGGIAQLLSPQPKINMDYGDGKKGTGFSGPVNNTVAGVPVPIAIGQVIIGSSVISASIVAEDVVV